MFTRNVTEHFSKNLIESPYFDLKSSGTEQPWIPTTTLQYSSTTKEVRQGSYRFLLSLLHSVEPDSYYRWIFGGPKKKTARGLSFVLCFDEMLCSCWSCPLLEAQLQKKFCLFCTAQSWCAQCVGKISKLQGNAQDMWGAMESSWMWQETREPGYLLSVTQALPLACCTTRGSSSNYTQKITLCFIMYVRIIGS